MRDHYCRYLKYFSKRTFGAQIIVNYILDIPYINNG